MPLFIFRQMRCRGCGIDLPAGAMLIHITRTHLGDEYHPAITEQLVPLVAVTFALEDGAHYNFGCRLPGCSFLVRVTTQDYARGHHDLMCHLYNHALVQRDVETDSRLHEVKSIFATYNAIKEASNTN